MFFRFIFGLILVVLISAAGIAVEKRTLELRRSVSHQTFQMDVLLEQHARSRLKVQQLGAPNRLIDAIESGRLSVTPTDAKSR